jgi:hypothetical protein
MFLADAMQIEVPFDLRRLRHLVHHLRRLLLRLGEQFLVEHVFAEHDAVVANVNARPGDQLFDLSVGFSAETTKGDVGRAGHAG